MTRLAESDARLRWMGVRPHQALAAVTSALLVVAGLTGALGPTWWVSGAVFAATTGLPWGVADTVGELAAVALAFGARERFHHARLLDVDGDAVVVAGGTTALHCYELDHRGRLDLNGGRERIGDALRELADVLAQRDVTSHVSLHVLRDEEGTRTFLALAPGISAPSGWRDVATPTALLSTGARLERWTYLRSRHGVTRTFRVFDFGGVRVDQPLLEAWQRHAPAAMWSLQVEVVSVSRARRVSARAAHQFDSDVAAATAAGFRRSARTQRRHLRVTRREALVAQGRALVRVALYVTCQADTLVALRARERLLIDSANDAGLRLERGWGRQFAWWSAQLPGGPSW
ncbi:MAG: hypothetical protein KGJ10_05980 [Acidobacteriota bacterium]|nr:hypothetical protein [Acidobacteriota bacterium]MDE3044360.1 hypothetical protein [Acidobacteriota bacterium]MDE3222358.1 hypothetical protein [Acidobacteriota bacterium]